MMVLKALADGLKCCPNLQTLYLSWNSIGDDGAKTLADGLIDKHCPTLDLSWNSIGDDGANALIDKHCPTLDLSWVMMVQRPLLLD